MVKYKQTQLDIIFHSLADSTRRDILQRLSVTNSLTASELAETYNISFPAVSKHLKILEKANFVKRKRLGRQHIFNLKSSQMEQAREWMDHWSAYWKRELDNLEQALAEK